MHEEMRRVLEFLEWKATWWTAQETWRSISASKNILEGLSAYAEVQSELQRALAAHFCTIWQQPLHDAETIAQTHGQVPHAETLDLSNNNMAEEEDDDDDGSSDDGAEEGDLEVGLDGEDGNESDTEGVYFHC